jgi:erythrin-vacuolar iron transport family protein
MSPSGTDSVRFDPARLSLQDALDLAILMEEEACQRYQEFTSQVGAGRYPGDAADMFKSMSAAEAKHRGQLQERRNALFGSAPSRLTADMLDDVEAPDRGAPRVFMSGRQAMEVALRAEEKARDFFADALKRVEDPQVRKLFEELRGEEEQHATYVRQILQKLPPGPDVEEDEADDPGSDPGN